jgi:hypothetical protein
MEVQIVNCNKPDWEKTKIIPKYLYTYMEISQWNPL